MVGRKKEMFIDEKLNNIIGEYWNDFKKKKEAKYVVKPSIPIIWFGNLENYKKSSLKIVTISINPSENEFKDNDGNLSFWRFNRINEDFSKKCTLNNTDKQILVDAYNSYFETNPYLSYFDYYNKILKDYFDCSYNGQKGNSAIHIDLYTPIATTFWKELDTKEKKYIQLFSKSKNGDRFILSFLEYLKPDIILFSTRKDELKKVFGINIKTDCIYKKPLRKSGKDIKGFSMELYKTSKNNQLILYGRNNYGKPFNLGDNFIKEARNEFIEKIKDYNNLTI